jgi:hypothetical protein
LLLCLTHVVLENKGPPCLRPSSEREVEERVGKEDDHNESAIEVVEDEDDRHEETYLFLDLLICYPKCLH